MNTTTTTTNDTKEVYGMVRFVAPGRTRAAYVRYINCATNRPVATGAKLALVMRESTLAEMVINLNKRGYMAQFVPTNHTCTMVHGRPAGF
jgi:hypothetical protein